MFTVLRIHLRLRIGDRESNRCLRSAFDADRPFPRMGPLWSSYATGRDERAGSSFKSVHPKPQNDNVRKHLRPASYSSASWAFAALR
jgi:hypothetical protein